MPIPASSSIVPHLLFEIAQMAVVNKPSPQWGQLLSRLRKHFPEMTAAEAEEETPSMKGRRPIFERNVNFARNRLVEEGLMAGHSKAGASSTPVGQWGPITPEGQEWLRRNWPPKKPVKAHLRRLS